MLVKNRALLVPGYNKAVQIGRTVINFSVKNTTIKENEEFSDIGNKE